MSRLRIVCRTPEPGRVEQGPAGPVTFNVLPSWVDVRVSLVNDDGTEEEITNITEVTWHAEAGTEPATATLKFIDVDLEVDGARVLVGEGSP